MAEAGVLMEEIVEEIMEDGQAGTAGLLAELPRNASMEQGPKRAVQN